MVDQVEAGPSTSNGHFPTDWHPHLSFDIAFYFKCGLGSRHVDSLENRETFETPGMQWMSTRSGVKHTEAGVMEKCDKVKGFQIQNG
jgi:redox-sensitive bicupin YhaK (pirin superfamily)